MDKRLSLSSRRGSFMSALSSIENIHKFVPGSISRAFSTQSREYLDVSDDEDFWPSNSEDIPLEEFAKNEQWKSIHRAIVSIFHQNVLTLFERTAICKNMSELRRSDIGPYIYNFYQKHLLQRGTKILLNKIETTTKDSIQEELLKVWNALYTEMLPLFITIFQSLSRKIAASSLQKSTLCAFRDDVLLKISTDDITMMDDKGEFPPELAQMLLVLQHYTDPDQSNKKTIDLEHLLSMVVTPYLGCYGYYDGNKASASYSKLKTMIPEKRRNNPSDPDRKLLGPYMKTEQHRPSSLLVPAIERLRQEHGSVHAPNSMLSTSSQSEENLLQQGRDYRRHSVQFDLR